MELLQWRTVKPQTNTPLLTNSSSTYTIKEMYASLQNFLSLIPFLILKELAFGFLYFLQSGLGGLSFDEGQFSVFGYWLLECFHSIFENFVFGLINLFLLVKNSCRYTTAGKDILGQIKTGDIIKSAKLIEGQDRLILPAQNNNNINSST